MSEDKISYNKLNNSQLNFVRNVTPVSCSFCRWEGQQCDLKVDHESCYKEAEDGTMYTSVTIIYRCPQCGHNTIDIILDQK